MSKARRQAKAPSRLPNLWLVLIGLLVLGGIAYSNSFSVPLVFDDLLSIQKNAAVRFGEFNWNPLSGRAVLYITFTLNHIWSGQDVWSYHLVNLLLHLANGVLLFFAGERVFAKAGFDERISRLYALAAAMFFVVHPIQTESVTYISSRSELLSVLFYLGAFLLFVSFSEARIGFLLSLGVAPFFLLGMSAKETVISLPATLFLYDFIVVSKSEWRSLLSRWRFYTPFILGGAIVAWYVATVTLRGSIGPGRENHLSVWNYFLTQLRVIVQYVYLTFFPVGLNLDYDFPASTTLLDPWVLGSLIFLTGIVVLGWRVRKSHPIFSFSIFWFFITLAPTSSFVPILDVIFEHRLYLPLVGVSLSFPLFVDMAAKWLRNWVPTPNPAAVTAILLVLLTIGTFRRNIVWGDEVRLFQDAHAKSPLKARPFTALAWAHYKKAEYDQAIRVLQQGLETIPSQARSFSDTLGQLYLKTGRYDDAIKLFNQILPLHKHRDLIALVHNNIGVAYLYKKKQLDEQRAQMAPADYDSQLRAILTPASESFAKAVASNPQMFTAWDSFINCSEYLGTMDALEAKVHAELEVEETFNNLYAAGKIPFLRGVRKEDANPRVGAGAAEFAKAAEYFERAEQVTSNEKLVYYNHAYALDLLQRTDEAIETYLRAIKIDPLFIEAHHNVALLYLPEWADPPRPGKNRYKEAKEHLLEFIRYDPNHPNTNKNLARIYAAEGNKAAARERLEILLKTQPGDPTIMQFWQYLGL
jgi:tetratricopeptide (TPR) repeat protein